MLDELTKWMQALLKRMSKIKDISKEKITVQFVAATDKDFLYLSGNVTYQFNKEPKIKFYKNIKIVPRAKGKFITFGK